MDKLMHWTQKSTDAFVYGISSGFVSQLEINMQENDISRGKLAERLGKSNGRVSQVLNDPGNLSLKTIVEYARALGMKVSIVAYEDGDPSNDQGPIGPQVFVKCWENANRPKDLFDAASVNAEESRRLSVRVDVTTIPLNFGASIIGGLTLMSSSQTVQVNVTGAYGNNAPYNGIGQPVNIAAKPIRTMPRPCLTESAPLRKQA